VHNFFHADCTTIPFHMIKQLIHSLVKNIGNWCCFCAVTDFFLFFSWGETEEVSTLGMFADASVIDVWPLSFSFCDDSLPLLFIILFMNATCDGGVEEANEASASAYTLLFANCSETLANWNIGSEAEVPASLAFIVLLQCRI